MAYTLSEALNILENGSFHSLAYVSLDKNRVIESGKIIRIAAGKILKHENSNQVKEDNTPVQKKSQRHYQHATRNLRLQNNEVRKFHIHTLFMLNNQPVL